MQSIVHYNKRKKENQKLKVVYDFVTYKSRNDQKKNTSGGIHCCVMNS